MYVGYVRIAMSIWYWILASVRTDVSARYCEHVINVLKFLVNVLIVKRTFMARMHQTNRTTNTPLKMEPFKRAPTSSPGHPPTPQLLLRRW